MRKGEVVVITEIKLLEDNGKKSFRRVMNDPTDEEFEEILQKNSGETKRKINVEPHPLRKEFQTKFDFGRYLVDLIPYTPENEKAIYCELENIGAWLSLKFIDVITEGKGQQRRFHDAKYRYIPNLDKEGTIYRHHVLGAWKIYGMHGDRSRVFLTGPPTTFTNMIAYPSLFQDVMESSAVCTALGQYFMNPWTDNLKEGWSRKMLKAIKIMNIMRRTQNLRLMDGKRLYQAFVDKLGEF